MPRGEKAPYEKARAQPPLLTLLEFGRGGYRWPDNATRVAFDSSGRTVTWATADGQPVSTTTREATASEKALYLKAGVTAFLELFKDGEGDEETYSVGYEVLQLWGWGPLFSTLQSEQPGGTSRVVVTLRAFAVLGDLARAIGYADNSGITLRSKLVQALVVNLRSVVVPIIQSKRDVEALREFAKRWEQFRLMAEWMRRICGRLDEQMARKEYHAHRGRHGYHDIDDAVDALLSASAPGAGGAVAVAAAGGGGAGGGAAGGKPRRGVRKATDKAMHEVLLRTGENSGAVSFMSEAIQMFRIHVFETCSSDFGAALRGLILDGRNGEGKPGDSSQVTSMLQLYVVMGICMEHNQVENLEKLKELAANAGDAMDAMFSPAGPTLPAVPEVNAPAAAAARLGQAGIPAQAQAAAYLAMAASSAAPSRAVVISDSSIYVTGFEKQFLEDSMAYYEARGNEFAALTGLEAVAKFTSMAAYEEEQVLRMMPRKTHRPLMALLAAHAVKPHVEALLDKPDGGLAYLLNRFNDEGLAALGADGSGAASTTVRQLSALFRVVARADGGNSAFAKKLQTLLSDLARKLLADRHERLRQRIEASPVIPGGVPEGIRKVKFDGDDPAFVQGLITLHSQYQRLIRDHLGEDRHCVLAMKTVFENYVNQPLPDDQDVGKLYGDTCPTIIEVIVAHFSAVLCGKRPGAAAGPAGGAGGEGTGGEGGAAGGAGGAGKMNDREIDDAIRQALPLFGYLFEKDDFLKKYLHELAKRLLNDRSESMEAEKAIIAAFKVHAAGGIEIPRLEGMIKDHEKQADNDAEKARMAAVYQRIKEKMTKHNLAVAANKPSPLNDKPTDGDGVLAVSSATAAFPNGVKIGGLSGKLPDFTVRVLTTHHWPSFVAPVPQVLPLEMRAWVKLYTEAYTSEPGHSHRKLDFKYAVGTVDLDYFCEGKTFHLTSLAPLSALALLAIANARGQCCSVEELAGALGLHNERDFDNLSRVLMPLVRSPRYKHMQLLREKGTVLDPKKPAFPKLTLKTVLELNPAFVEHKTVKINPGKVELENSDTKAILDAEVIQGRDLAIEAAIVRVMKTRKTLRHHELISAVVAQIRLFTPEARDIKKRAENLIEREYLERDEDDPSAYKYLA